MKNRQQVLTVAVIAVASIWIGDRFVRAPLMASWSQRSTRIAELRKSVNDGSMLLKREQTIRNSWDHMRTNMLPINASEAENEILRAFERWSQDSRISITSIKPQWKRVEDDYVTLECRADAYGSVQALTRFLYSVEQDPLALKVESLEITSRDNDGQQLSLALQVSGVVLGAPEP